jgi:hypothetical protein
MEVAYMARLAVSAAYTGTERCGRVGGAGNASSWMYAQKRRARETALAQCVDGMPYSRW